MLLDSDSATTPSLGTAFWDLSGRGQGENARTLSHTCPVLMGGYTRYIIRKRGVGLGLGEFECAVIRGCFFMNGKLDRRQCFYAIAWDGVLRPRRDRRQCCCAIARL
ncbi:hypothetical protein PG993_012371 [Apiospora rasikravindrae]|uniref:Uncharacterized protein n=1 Tax=Apiospora rasikravindrae TaxID=990691 RepID=A0ABR1S3P1_9PEZI